MAAQHTPGPWRWELNEKHKNLQLVGGRPMYDLTVMEPQRWGMGSATLFFRDTAEDGFNILHRVHERRDWIAPHAGRAHHVTWFADVSHPDARLIAAAPELLAALIALHAVASVEEDKDYAAVTNAAAVISKATGATP